MLFAKKDGHSPNISAGHKKQAETTSSLPVFYLCKVLLFCKRGNAAWHQPSACSLQLAG
jgi:hypothetical protein